MDATAWGAIGGGLSALSEGLTAMQLRKLAKQREDEERERQKEEAALRKAQLKAQEFQSMDARNFKKVSENGQVTNKANANALLNAAAFGRGGEQVKGDISGDTYFRGAGESPNDQARAAKEAQIQNALDKITLSKQYDEQIARLKAQAALDQKAMVGGDTRFTQDRIDGRYDRTPDVVKTTEAGKDRRFNTGEAGKDRRQENSQTGTSAKPPTESQAKDAKYYDMMEKAVPVLDRLADKVRGDRISLAIRSPEMISNRFLTPEEQEYLRAARDFATGVYRPETGASAKPSEIQDVFNRYLTVGGDAPAIKQIKATAREGKLVTQRNAALPALKYYQTQQSILNASQGSGKAIDALKTLGVP